jgi:hypothetical protein
LSKYSIEPTVCQNCFLSLTNSVRRPAHLIFDKLDAKASTAHLRLSIPTFGFFVRTKRFGTNLIKTAIPSIIELTSADHSVELSLLLVGLSNFLPQTQQTSPLLTVLLGCQRSASKLVLVVMPAIPSQWRLLSSIIEILDGAAPGLANVPDRPLIAWEGAGAIFLVWAGLPRLQGKERRTRLSRDEVSEFFLFWRV